MRRPFLAPLVVSVVSIALPGCERRTEFTGGTRLTLRFDPGESALSPDALRAGLVGVTESRLDRAGVHRFRVRAESGNRIRVEVPYEETTLDFIKNIVTVKGGLAFHLVAEDEVTGAELDRHQREERAYRDALRDWHTRQREWNAKREKEPASTEPRPRKPVSPERIVRSDADGERLLLENTQTGHVSGTMLEDASETMDRNGRPALTLQFTRQGGARLEVLTTKGRGRQLAIVLDDTVIQTAVIEARIGRYARITGDFTREEILEMVIVLESGRLPASLELVGEESIDNQDTGG